MPVKIVATVEEYFFRIVSARNKCDINPWTKSVQQLGILRQFSK